MTHIYPLNDVFEHDLSGLDCECNPEIDFNAELVIHFAFDGRDLIEEVGDRIVELPSGRQINTGKHNMDHKVRED